MSDFILILLITIGVTLLVLILAAAFVGWRVWRSDERRLAKRIATMPFGDKMALARGLFTDPRVPLWARIVAVALVLYIASPIDLIPDFIPLLGLVDDVLIVMVGAGLLLRSVSPQVIEEHLQRYETARQDAPPALPAPR